MIAIILAAGEGTRLRPHTATRPKCLVEMIGQSLLSHQVDALNAAGVDNIAVVTGYRGEQIQRCGYRTFENREFRHTNMVSSLMCASSLLDGSDDVLICYADIVYEPRIILDLVRCCAEICISVDQSWRTLWQARFLEPLMDAETLRIDDSGNVVEVGKRPCCYEDIEAQYMGLIRVRATAARRLVDFYDALDPQEQYDGQSLDHMYMTSFLQRMIDEGHQVRAVTTQGGWLEVDSTNDLDLYEELHRTGRLSQFWSP